MHHVNFFQIVIVLFLITLNECLAENPKLTVDLANSGFHRFVQSYNFFQHRTFFQFQYNSFFRRDINYVVVFPEYQGKHHTFLIKQLLPASVYVSIDQLNDLNRFDKVNIFRNSFKSIYCLWSLCHFLLAQMWSIPIWRVFFQIHYFIDKEFIDVEKPTELCEPFDIYLYGNTAFLQTISLPIHFRYHAPGNKRWVPTQLLRDLLRIHWS